MKSAVIMFPGSNCDRDMAVALESVSGQAAHMVWHGDNDLPSGLDVIAIPGGFSYGDYLRCGAMASQSHIIPEILKAAQKGVKILGVCNGFQILTEIGLLPGALMRNRDMNFICRDVALVSGKSGGILGSTFPANQEISLPVAHHDGNFFADDTILNELEDSNRVAFRYAENINGSARDIAGIMNKNRNVFGMMPHPERAIDPLHGGIDGRLLFEALYAS